MNIKIKDEKNWVIREYDEKVITELSQKLGITEFVAKLLAVRGITDAQDATDFLHSESFDFHDPFLLCDMDKAVKRIYEAIEKNERILIYGDYDVDGISSVSALYLCLASLGANVCYYIPERLSEGYGLNTAAIDKFAAARIGLIITVDTGITAVNEAKHARDMGLDIIITDHHECPSILPDAACAVINPKRADSKYPFSMLAGVGVVFKLICALEKDKKSLEEICADYLDIVSLGTVADVMPVYGENRRIIKHGLEYLNATKNIGIKAIIDEAISDGAQQKAITSTTIGFVIAPRLNAAGRIGNVKHAAELLISRDAARAKEIASELCALNKERQNIENVILAEAIEQIERDFDFENDRVIVLSHDGWHQGVIGIVASKITEKYGLPSILVTFTENNGKGSARSIPGFNINTALSFCSDTLIKSGGHELAAGLSVTRENFEAFRKQINDYAKDLITEEMRVPSVFIDCEVSSDELDMTHALELASLEPYGNSNPSPVFVCRNMKIESIQPVGQNKHLKLVLSKDGKKYSAMYFNKTPEEFGFIESFSADVAFNMEVNDFRGTKMFQMNIRDMKLAGDTLAYINSQAKEYLRAITANTVRKENLPDMQNFRAAFIFMRTQLSENPEMDIYKTSFLISRSFSMEITPCMLNIMLDVFSEMGLLEVGRTGLNIASVRILEVENKVNIENSKLLTKLRNAVI